MRHGVILTWIDGPSCDHEDLPDHKDQRVVGLRNIT